METGHQLTSPNHGVNGQTAVSAPGLLTTVTPLAVSVSTPAVTTTAPSGFNGDRDDSNLDAELLALAAQQMRPPSVPQPQTPTQPLRLEQIKPNPAKWTVNICCFKLFELT